MYRWQTLTLARIEHLSGSAISAKQAAAARDLLFAIGTQHFPEPFVSFIGGDRGSKQFDVTLSLMWTVDDRTWNVSIDSDGCCHDSGESSNEGFAGSMRWPETDPVRSGVHWLLFGHFPPSPACADESSRTDPLPSADAAIINQKAFMRP